MGGLRSSPTYSYRHNSSYIFRITTPFDIIPYINKKEFHYSLRTGSLSVAKFRVRGMRNVTSWRPMRLLR